MKTGCDSCDDHRAYMLGRLAGWWQKPKQAPEDYDARRTRKWLDGYEREERKRLAAPDRPRA